MIGKSLRDSEDFSTYSLDFVAEWVVSSSHRHRHWIADWIDHGVSDRPRPRTLILIQWCERKSVTAKASGGQAAVRVVRSVLCSPNKRVQRLREHSLSSRNLWSCLVGLQSSSGLCLRPPPSDWERLRGRSTNTATGAPSSLVAPFSPSSSSFSAIAVRIIRYVCPPARPPAVPVVPFMLYALPTW